jgi:hypothetical protein
MAGRGNSPTVYALRFPLQYWTAPRNGIPGQIGEGMTTAISSRLVQFRSDRSLAAGCKIQLQIAWPAGLPDGVRLNLCICGVTQSASGNVEVSVTKYEFRTRRRRPVPQSAASGTATVRSALLP